MMHSKIELPPLILNEVREAKNPLEEESPQKPAKSTGASKHRVDITTPF